MGFTKFEAAATVFFFCPDHGVEGSCPLCQPLKSPIYPGSGDKQRPPVLTYSQLLNPCFWDSPSFHKPRLEAKSVTVPHGDVTSSPREHKHPCTVLHRWPDLAVNKGISLTPTMPDIAVASHGGPGPRTARRAVPCSCHGQTPAWERDTHVEKLRDKAALTREVSRKPGSLAAQPRRLVSPEVPRHRGCSYCLRGIGIECSDGQLSSARKREGNR